MLVANNTPIEKYLLHERLIWVKREDLCCPYPGPAFSKVRGLSAHLKVLSENGILSVGVISTLVSKAGWGTAYISQPLNMKCYNFYPRSGREDVPVKEYCGMSEEFGGIQVDLTNTRGSIFWHRAKKYLSEHEDGHFEMLTHHLKLQETIVETAAEFYRTIEAWGEFPSTIIIPVGSGTICAGVLSGIEQTSTGKKHLTCKVIGVTATKDVDEDRRRASIIKAANVHVGSMFDAINHFEVVKTYRAYMEPVSRNTSPFPCNPWYDAKAWEWLDNSIAAGNQLDEPVLFWNIGS